LNLIDVFLLAIALGIDCLVVSFAHGLIFTQNRVENSLKLATFTGGFQGIMPIIGFIGTDYIYDFIEPFSKWLVFAIFLILGMKFIFEAFQPKEDKVCCLGIKCLIGLGIATSIDALVAGASLNLTETPLFSSALIIGIFSFVMSLGGFWLGNFGKIFSSKYLEITGGMILVFLALKSILI